MHRGELKPKTQRLCLGSTSKQLILVPVDAVYPNGDQIRFLDKGKPSVVPGLAVAMSIFPFDNPKFLLSYLPDLSTEMIWPIKDFP
jgi:hypothetical protein